MNIVVLVIASEADKLKKFNAIAMAKSKVILEGYLASHLYSNNSITDDRYCQILLLHGHFVRTPLLR